MSTVIKVEYTYENNLLTVEVNGKRMVEEEIFDTVLAMDKVTNIEEKISFKNEQVSCNNKTSKLSV